MYFYSFLPFFLFPIFNTFLFGKFRTLSILDRSQNLSKCKHHNIVFLIFLFECRFRSRHNKRNSALTLFSFLFMNVVCQRCIWVLKTNVQGCMSVIYYRKLPEVSSQKQNNSMTIKYPWLCVYTQRQFEKVAPERPDDRRLFSHKNKIIRSYEQYCGFRNKCYVDVALVTYWKLFILFLYCWSTCRMRSHRKYE